MAAKKATATTRLERGDGAGRVFWEVTRTKTSVTTRYGRHLNEGRTTPAKAYETVAAAEAAVAEAIAAKRAEGYGDVRARAEAGATSKKGVSVQNAELEALIDEDPTDAERYLVYADWLQQQGDPRGELIVIQHGIATSTDTRQVTKLERDSAALFKKYERELLGPLAPYTFLRHSTRSFRTFSWRYGFIHGARLAPLRFRQIEVAPVLASLLQHPAGRFLEYLMLGALPSDSTAITTVLRAHAPATLTSIFVGDTSNNTTYLSTLDSLWTAAPRLRALVVEGAIRSLGTIEAPLLESLRFTAAGEVTLDVLRQTALPALRSLELTLSPSADGAPCLGELVAGAQLPALERLQVRQWITTPQYLSGLRPQDDLAFGVLYAAAKRKLPRLDLEVPLSRAAVAKLRADAAPLRAIGAIHLPGEGVDADDRDALAAALPALVWTDPPEEEEPDLPEIHGR